MTNYDWGADDWAVPMTGQEHALLVQLTPELDTTGSRLHAATRGDLLGHRRTIADAAANNEVLLEGLLQKVDRYAAGL